MYQTILQFVWHLNKFGHEHAYACQAFSTQNGDRSCLIPFVSYLYTCKTFGDVKLLDPRKTFGDITYIGNLHSCSL